ncbi:MAG: DUF502 domain-containing protein [Phycisphaerae bacterium]|nr:DUF502 domain-containing protein [Phycisphaerae bacterium]
MKSLFKYFGRGLLFLIPVGATMYVIYWVFTKIGGTVWDLIDKDPENGINNFWGYLVGITVTIAVILTAGVLTSLFITKPLTMLVEKLFGKLPLISLLYSSIKDLIGAFVGDQKKFDTPVMVELIPGTARSLGFITRKSMEVLDRPDDVAVYFPQSYNFAGSVLIIPANRVEPIDMDSSDVMTFIVSGGVSGLHKGKPEDKEGVAKCSPE